MKRLTILPTKIGSLSNPTPSLTQKAVLSCLWLLPAAMTMTSCSLEQSDGLGAPPSTEASEPANDSEESLDTEQPGAAAEAPLTQAEGWSALLVTSDFAETEIDAAGHFLISRNNCWVRGDGVMDPEPWFKLTPILNKWIQNNWLLTEENSFTNSETSNLLCTAVGTGIRDFEGQLEFKKSTERTAKKLPLLTLKWSEAGRVICGALPTSEKDSLQIAVQALNQTLKKAFSEDCTITPQ